MSFLGSDGLALLSSFLVSEVAGALFSVAPLSETESEAEFVDPEPDEHPSIRRDKTISEIVVVLIVG